MKSQTSPRTTSFAKMIEKGKRRELPSTKGNGEDADQRLEAKTKKEKNGIQVGLRKGSREMADLLLQNFC